MSSGISRRGLLSLLARPLRAGTATNPTPPSPQSGVRPPESSPTLPDRVAVIQGRYCLAYTSFCTVCSERCPVPGAMKVERGIPMVVPEVCTGCGVCHDVCPAPKNAVLVLPRRQPPAPFPQTANP